MMILLSLIIFLINQAIFYLFQNKEIVIDEDKYTTLENDFDFEPIYYKKTEQKIVLWQKDFSQKYVITNYTNWNLDTKIALIDEFLKLEVVNKHIWNLEVKLHWEKKEVRWKMVKWIINIFDVQNLSDREFLWIFLHELWHYIDIYSLKKLIIWDESFLFYDISWDFIKVLKPWQKEDNFVSGYAMTNRYEDFAETFVEYILDNSWFYEKTKTNNELKSKYDFFTNTIFGTTCFDKTTFSKDSKSQIEWDSTKNNYDFEKFFDFIKKMDKIDEIKNWL